MSAKRNHYTSTPLMRMDKRPHSMEREEPPIVLEEEAEKVRHFRLLQFIMLLLLPAAFVAAMIIQLNTVGWAFIGAALFFVLVMWLLRAFTYNARSKMTLIYILACAVVATKIILSSPGSVTQRVVSRVDSSSIFGTDSALDTPSLSQIESVNNVSTEETPEPQATDAPISAAQARLEEFMNYWALGDSKSMLNMCSPAWIDKQNIPEARLWDKTSMFTPTGFYVERVYGSDADSSRSIMIVATIERPDHTTESRRYQIMMVRSNDVWYIDPDSLSHIGIVTPDDPLPFEQISSIIQDATNTPTPVPTVNPSTPLYYNQGGKYYHVDPYCSAVNAKYYPIPNQISYGQLDDPDYRTLKPCRTCHAPARPK